MAKSNNTNNGPYIKGIDRLNKITRTTNARTYGVSRDLADTLGNSVDNFIDSINKDSEKDKSLLNSHMSRSRLANMNNKPNKNRQDIYDIIEDKKMMESISTIIGSENLKFQQTLKDYEVIKRCIPQVHKVITSLKNNIISPDSMVNNKSLGIQIPNSCDKSDSEAINRIIEKYKLNEKLQTIVMEYLIASVKYMTVAPYSLIPEMLHKDPDEDMTDINLNEAIDILERSIDENTYTLAEVANGVTNDSFKSMCESAGLDYVDDYGSAYIDAEVPNINGGMDRYQISAKSLNETLSNIEFVDGGMTYFKKAILNEAIIEADDKSSERSIKNVVDRLKKHSKKTSGSISVDATEGLIDDKTYKDIKKNVDFKGCHIEELPASRTIAFKMRDTTVGYFYVEDKIDDKNKNDMSSIMDKINASVYIKNNTDTQAQKVESLIVKQISEKLVKAVNSKFINDNYEDMDILYEFVKNNELHKKSKRVVFFHPDDVCEFKRQDGSIMKNCMFMAKLYILTILSNVITNVTRGADRNIHYVKSGLSTDIEGHVNSAIRAIKQGQIRYSDTGTINEIFNLVGSNVDVFMPVSVDGEKPIETETMSGQNVDMNNDFLNFLIRSIILSFGVPVAVIDDYEQVDFAKTLAMSNLDMAKAVLDAQNEICEPLTKLLRLIVQYELPNFEYTNDIFAKLTPPSDIIFEMNRNKIDAISQVSEYLVSLYFPQDDNETPNMRRARLFRLEYAKRNMPTLNWAEIDEMYTSALHKSKEEEQYQQNDQDNY